MSRQLLAMDQSQFMQNFLTLGLDALGTPLLSVAVKDNLYLLKEPCMQQRLSAA